MAPLLRRIHTLAADFGVFVLDLCGRVASWNALAERVSGYQADEILGRKLSRLYARSAGAVDKSVAERQLTRTLRIAAATGRCEDRVSLASKGVASFWVEITVTAVRDSNGDPCGFGCTIRDISESRQSQLDLAGVRDTELESSPLRSAFLSNISHEFRTPLNIILGYSDLIGEYLAANRDSSQRDNAEAVARACKRLLRTLDAMLDYSQIESHSFAISPRTLELAPLIRRLIGEHADQASEKGLRLTCALDTDDIAVTTDEYCVMHSVRNLIENAIKFTERGGVAVSLYREVSGAVCITVTDTGIGVDKDYLPHLLEPFSQEDSGDTRRFEGAGLGLALSRRYLELNGASLSAHSDKGVGSSFTIRFARAAEPEHTATGP